jgi:tetratricopeptide (TPR) repeat protein
MRNLFAVWGCLDPGSARFAHFFSAEALYLARVDESALSAYLAAIGAFPENAYYRFRLGEVYMALGRQAEAVEQFNRAAAMRAWKNPLRKDYLAETAAALQVTDQGEEASDFEATGMHSMGDGR